MSPAVNVTLEEVPFAILEAVKARILANRRRLDERKQQPSTRPRPQFRNVGASSKAWRPPQPVAGVFITPKMVAGFLLRRIPTTGINIEYIEISDFERNTTYQVDVKEFENPFPGGISTAENLILEQVTVIIPSIQTYPIHIKRKINRRFQFERQSYDGDNSTSFPEVYQEGIESIDSFVKYPLFVPVGGDKCIVYIPSSYNFAGAWIEEEQINEEVYDYVDVVNPYTDVLYSKYWTSIAFDYSYDYTIHEDQHAKDNSKAFMVTKKSLKEIPVDRAKSIFNSFAEHYADRENPFTVETSVEEIDPWEPSERDGSGEVRGYPYPPNLNIRGRNLKYEVTRSVTVETFVVTDDGSGVPPPNPGSSFTASVRFDSQPREVPGFPPGSLVEPNSESTYVNIYVGDPVVSVDYSEVTINRNPDTADSGIEEKTITDFFNDRSTQGSPPNSGSVPIISPGVFDVIKDPENQNWNTPKPELRQPKYSLVQNQGYSSPSPTTGLIMRRFDTTSGAATTPRPLNVVPRTQQAPEDSAVTLRSVVCWDWAEPAYCRQQCLEIGFTPEDLQPADPPPLP
jgi:hypothetical protein